MIGNDVDEVYADIIADIAKLARQLTKADAYKSASGPTALLIFADHLEGIIAAVAAHPCKSNASDAERDLLT